MVAQPLITPEPRPPEPEPVRQPPAPEPARPTPGQFPEGQGYFPQGVPPGPGYMMPPPWYPPYGVPPSPYFGFPPPGQTGQMPIIPRMPPAGMPIQSMPPGAYPGVPQPPGMTLGSLEEPEFDSLTRGETSHWRGDFKWVFGIITAVLIFVALATAGLYRITGPGAARQVLVPLIESSTRVQEFVKDNYSELRSKARKSKSASIYIPDIGVTVSVTGDVINSLSSEDLAQRVILDIEKQIYANGYRRSLPMKAAQGAGEERAKATCVTVLSELNKAVHSDLLWPIIIFGVLALAFGILFIVFCRGWGKVVGAGIAIICGAIPGSLFLRVGSQFVWKVTASGTFKPAANQALRTMSSLGVAFFDIALAFGAVVLLVGVIGSIIARKSRERITPFTELKATDETPAGRPAESGGTTPGDQAPSPDEDSFFLNE
ncbi:MAG: hypothetical protein ACYC99_05550 [Candidatus Geothermincolia bacterium]